MIKADETMTIKIGRFGSGSADVTLPKDSTVEEALEEAGITFSSTEKVMVNGERASANDILENGDVVNIFSPKEAGSEVTANI